LELHDAGLVIVGESDLGVGRIAASPGYALIDGESLITGSAAAARSRLKPRRVSNRFWDALDTTPLGRPFPRQVSAADLAHAHLYHLWELAGEGVEELILAVPGSHDAEQLGLILGVARACGMPVHGMVDSAVAAAVHGWPGARMLHVDLQLHRAVVTELTQTDEVARGRVEVGEQSGLAVVQDALLRRVAELFLHDTRFDPLHAAETEQRLLDALAHWLARLHREDGFALRFESAGREYSIELTRARLASAVDAHYERIARIVGALKPAGETTTVLLSYRAAMLPGLEGRLAAIANTHVVALAETTVAAGAIICRDRIRSSGDELPFVVQLPVRPGLVATPPPTVPSTAGQERARDTNQPTHVLLDGVAHAIDEEPLVFGVAIPAGARGVNLPGPSAGISRSHCSIFRRGGEVLVEDHSSHGSFVNGARVEGRAPLAPGDRLRLGSPGVELQLIRVAETDGSTQS
jgi:hypothetical protein